MSNMSYVRFENTNRDLRDCLDNVDESLELGSTEAKARENLIKTAFALVRPYLEYSGNLHGMSIKLNVDEVLALPKHED